MSSFIRKFPGAANLAGSMPPTENPVHLPPNRKIVIPKNLSKKYKTPKKKTA